MFSLIGTNKDGSPYEPKGAWGLFASHLADYMHRWVLKTPFGSLRLHRILRRDLDRDPHDHPFDFTSLILFGGYVEERHDTRDGKPVNAQTTFYPAGSILRRRAEDAHRIVYVLPGTLTLVLTSGRKRSWGFCTHQGWIPWRTYVGTNSNSEKP